MDKAFRDELWQVATELNKTIPIWVEAFSLERDEAVSLLNDNNGLKAQLTEKDAKIAELESKIKEYEDAQSAENKDAQEIIDIIQDSINKGNSALEVPQK